MSAFESSPVHCLNRHPCLNFRNSGKAGVAASLDDIESHQNKMESIQIEGIPSAKAVVYDQPTLHSCTLPFFVTGAFLQGCPMQKVFLHPPFTKRMHSRI